jgi:hypothetical protein
MNAFDYLAVIISIVLGLSLTQLLTGLGRMIQLRRHIRFYWPAVLAILALTLADVQYWWSMFGLRLRADWDFAGFSVVLAQAALLSIASTVIVPAMPEGPAEKIDMKAAYFDHSRWYYGLLLGLLAVSLAKTWVLEHALPHPPDLAAHGVFAVLFATGAISRSDRVHKVLSPLLTAIFVAYVVLLFARLGAN